MLSDNAREAAARPRVSPARALPYIAAAGTGLAIALACTQHFGAESVLCVLIGALILAPLAVRWWTKRFDLFEPAVLVATVYFVYFVFAPLVRFATGDVTFIQRNFEHDYMGALVAVLVAVVAMWLGYAMPIGPAPEPADARAPVAPPEVRRAARRFSTALIVGAVVCMTLWARLAHRSLWTFLLPGLVPANTSEEGGTDIGYLFLSIEWFVPALVVLIAAGGLRGRVRRIAAVLAVTLIYVSIGFRYRIVLLWLAVGMLVYLQAGRRPRVRNLVIPGALAFLASGWLAQARLFFRSAGTAGGLGFNLRDAILVSLADTRIFETFAAVLRVIPGFIAFSGVAPFTYPFILPIPRSLWFGKPLPKSLQDIGASVGTPESGAAGLAVPHFGEYYLAFGWPGIAVGMFLFGVGIKWLWRWYRAAPSDPWRQAIFVLNNALLFQVIIRGYFAQIVMEWCFLVLPAIVVVALARRAGRRRPSASSVPRIEVPESETARA